MRNITKRRVEEFFAYQHRIHGRLYTDHWAVFTDGPAPVGYTRYDFMGARQAVELDIRTNRIAEAYIACTDRTRAAIAAFNAEEKKNRDCASRFTVCHYDPQKNGEGI